MTLRTETMATEPMPSDGTPRRVVVVGQGYVGLPVAMRAVKCGFDVVGYDVDKRRIERLNDGESYIEDVPNEVLRDAIASGRYRASAQEASCQGFDIAVVTVPTPLQDDIPDLSFVEAAAATLAGGLGRGATVVLESTTYPGTTEELVVPLLEEGSGLTAGDDFHVGYSPERIDPGNHIWTFATTPKIVSGINAESLAAVRSFYDALAVPTVPVRGTREAELAKLLENTFRHVNVALVNEFAMLARELNIDIWETIRAADTKPFGFLAFKPGPGVGGHCLPIDPSYLSWRVKRRLGRTFRFVELANDINDHMPDYVVSRITTALNAHRKAVCGSRVLLLGLAYKPNTADTRESPTSVVADKLLALGAQVAVADPHVALDDYCPATRVELTEREVSEADAVVLLTDHDAFDYSLVGAHSGLVLDARHRLPQLPTVEYL
jgi:UDP-N-acetyl-D-glucosamine dehydrogenase